MSRRASRPFSLTRLAPLAALASCALAAGAFAAQQPAGPAASQTETGTYLSIFWLVMVFLALCGWGYATGWISEDAAGVGLDNRKWVSIMTGAGALGLLLIVLIHGVLVFLMILGVAGATLYYIYMRDEVVPSKFRILFHKEAGAAPLVKAAGVQSARFTGKEAAEPAKEVRLNVRVVNSAGKSLDDFVAAQPAMEEAIGVLAETICNAVALHARAVRIEPGPGEFPVTFDMDDVFAPATTLEPEIGQAILAGTARFAGLGGKGKAVAPLTVTTAEGQTFEITAKAIKGKAGPAILFLMPDWTKDIYKGGLAAMGMHPAMIERVKKVVATGGTTMLITGLPRSGRTSTFHGAIAQVDIFTTDVVLLEKDPIHDLDQVKRQKVDLDSTEAFHAVWATLLREEPNVVGVDELRNARIATPLVEFAAKGGRLVAVLEASSSTDAVERLCKAVKPNLLAKTFACALNQKLIRKLCDACKEEVEPNPQLLAKLKIPPQEAGTWFRPVGCEQCLNTGYRGRTAIYEMLVMTEELRAALAGGQTKADALRKAAGTKGIRTLYQDGLLKVQQGITSFDELRRIVKQTQEQAG
jgi:general secretion pathway protein E